MMTQQQRAYICIYQMEQDYYKVFEQPAESTIMTMETYMAGMQAKLKRKKTGRGQKK